MLAQGTPGVPQLTSPHLGQTARWVSPGPILTVPVQAEGQPSRGFRQKIWGQLRGAGLGLLGQPQPQEELQFGTDLPRGCPRCLCGKEACWAPQSRPQISLQRGTQAPQYRRHAPRFCFCSFPHVLHLILHLTLLGFLYPQLEPQISNLPSLIGPQYPQHIYSLCPLPQGPQLLIIKNLF